MQAYKYLHTIECGLTSLEAIEYEFYQFLDRTIFDWTGPILGDSVKVVRLDHFLTRTKIFVTG